MTDNSNSRTRTRVWLDDDVLDRLRRYAHWDRRKLQHILEDAITDALDRAEEAHGGPYPPMPNGATQLPVGAPLRAS